MKTNMLVVVLGALITSAGIAGCGSDATSSPSGTGGSSGAATGGTTQAGSGGAGGASACDATYKCQQAITPPSNDPSKLCPGTVAAAKFDLLQACLCTSTGACSSKCGASVCAQQAPSLDCLTCIMDSTAGCGKLTTDCAAN